MIIKSIKIENFKNIQMRVLDSVDPSRNSIVAKNGWGKSNTIDAILWVFTDKLKNNNSDIQSIKAKPILNDPLPSEQSKVATVTITTDVGTFQKSYMEVWKTIRGIERKVLSGHETKYMIDNVEYPKNKYEVELAGRLKMPLQFIPILMQSDYFGKILDYKERRKIVSEIVGVITVDDVSERFPQVERVRELLTSDLSLETLIKTNKQEVNKLREQEKAIETSISAHGASVVSLEDMKTKGDLKRLLSDTSMKIAYIEKKLVSTGMNDTPELWNNRLNEIAKSYLEWKDVKAPRITCLKCGYVHETSKTIEELIQDGKNARQALNNVNNKMAVVLSDDDKQALDELRKKEQEIDSMLKVIYASEQAVEKIKELKPQLQEVINKAIAAEQTGDLLNIYLDKWVVVFNDRVNELFKSSGITFKMFDYKLNGALDETCEMLDRLVPYEKTNTASQIKLGIKLIDALKELKGYQDLPILIDNAEAVVDKDFETNAQLIMFSAGKGN